MRKKAYLCGHKSRGGDNVVRHHGRVAPAHREAQTRHDSTIQHVQLHSTSIERQASFDVRFPPD